METKDRTRTNNVNILSLMYTDCAPMEDVWGVGLLLQTRPNQIPVRRDYVRSGFGYIEPENLNDIFT